MQFSSFIAAALVAAPVLFAAAFVENDWVSALPSPIPIKRIRLEDTFEDMTTARQFYDLVSRGQTQDYYQLASINICATIVLLIGTLFGLLQFGRLVNQVGKDRVNAALELLSDFEKTAFIVFALETERLHVIDQYFPCLSNHPALHLYRSTTTGSRTVTLPLESIQHLFDLFYMHGMGEHAKHTISLLGRHQFETALDYSIEHNMECAHSLFYYIDMVPRSDDSISSLSNFSQINVPRPIGSAGQLTKFYAILSNPLFVLNMLNLQLANIVMHKYSSATERLGIVVDLMHYNQWHLAAYILFTKPNTQYIKLIVEQWHNVPKFIDAVTRLPYGHVVEIGPVYESLNISTLPVVWHIKLIKTWFGGASIKGYVVKFVEEVPDVYRRKELLHCVIGVGEESLLADNDVIASFGSVKTMQFAVFSALSGVEQGRKREVYPHLLNMMERAGGKFNIAYFAANAYFTESFIVAAKSEYRQFKAWNTERS